jgi:hypothetical protein
VVEMKGLFTPSGSLTSLAEVGSSGSSVSG